MLVETLLPLMVFTPLAGAVMTRILASRENLHNIAFSIASSVLTFVFSAALLLMALLDTPQQVVDAGFAWGSLLFDPLSSLMAFVIAGISMLVHIYSRRYMLEESGYGRFFSLLGLMTSSLLLMVTAGDLISLLIAWHLIGILLYFLLSHDSSNPEAHRFAGWTLLTYRFGDLPLLIAFLLLFQAFDSWSMQDIFKRLQDNPELTTLFGLPLAETVAALIALSAFARSAQFFLHTWLPYSMSGPTPVSALMHAGIVNAGGFLINRFAPLFLHTDMVLHWVFIVGLTTAIIGSVLMLAQNDIKKALGYSTMGQMGFMIMECGVGAFSLAIYHLIAHGLFKGTLFLSAGSVINQARDNDGVPKDDLYTFVVEKRPAQLRKPWLVMALLTLIVPIIILTVAHWLVAADYFHQQGAVVLLFFGWVTGAQLIFATYRMRSQNIWRLMGLMLMSFTIVIVGYAFISHAFDIFLYPDAVIREGIHAAAGIDIFWFDMLVLMVTLVVVIGWLAAYYADSRSQFMQHHIASLRQRFYSLLAAEFFIAAFYRRLSNLLLQSANRLNVMLKWY